MDDYVGDLYSCAKFYHDTITIFCPTNMRKCASSDLASFLVLPSAYSQDKTPAPIFTISMSNYVVSRKDVPFGGPKNKFYISTPFSTTMQSFDGS